MSDTTKQYTLTLTDADLAALRDIVRATDEHPLLLAKLYKVRAVKTRAAAKPAPEPEPFTPDTGDEKLDAWLIAHHRPDWRERLATALKPRRRNMIPMPAPAPGIARKPMSQQERADLYRAHVIRSVGV